MDVKGSLLVQVGSGCSCSRERLLCRPLVDEEGPNLIVKLLVALAGSRLDELGA